MLIPLGLGVKIPRFPFITLFLVALNCYLFFSQPKIDYVALDKKVKNSNPSALIAYYNEKDYLNKSNITISSLTKAQFAHGNLIHLIGNMIALLGFGIYVETRLGVANFLLVYLLGGFLGLGGSTYFFMKPDSFLLGASANVFSIMGSFFILFYRHYIRFFLFYFVVWKRILLPVKYSFPFFFILVEMANQLLAGNNVANDAHLIGMGVGLLFSLIFLKANPIKWPFIYQAELEKFKSVKKLTNFEDISNICNDILEYNPINYKVRLFVLLKAIERFEVHGKLDKKSEQVFQDHLERYIGKFIKEKRFDLCSLLLNKIPFSLPLFPYLKGLSQKQIIKFGDYFLDNNNYCEAIRIYQIFIDYYPDSKRTKNILKTCDGILNAIQTDEDFKKAITMKQIKPNNPLSGLIDNLINLKNNRGA